jgi:hypothetical protein
VSTGVVYLVVMDVGGLFGVWHDHERASDAASAIKGVVCQLPILEDYRPDPRHPTSKER